MSDLPPLMIRQDLSPELLVFRCIDRVNSLAVGGDVEAYNQAVLAVMDNMPPAKLLEVQAMEEEYTEEYWWYKTSGRYRIGTIENPIHGSPELKTRIDYRKLFQVVLHAFNAVGTLWKVDKVTAEYGWYPTDIEATPVEDKKKLGRPDTKATKLQTCYILYLNPRTGKHEIKKVMNWRGFAVGIGGGESPWFFNNIQTSLTKQESIVLLITGDPGRGKTYCALRLAEIFDRSFDPDLQCVMDRKDAMKLISGLHPLKRGQVILIDESQFGMSARGWTDKEQQEFIHFLAAARSKGYIIIIVALHISMVDSIARKRIMRHMIHIEERGRGIVYHLRGGRFSKDVNYFPPRLGQLILQLPDYERCAAATCLTCKHRETCMSIRAIYERNKSRFLIERAQKAADVAEQRERQHRVLDEDKLFLRIVEAGDEIVWTVRGYIDSAWIQNLIETEFDASVGMTKAMMLGKKAKMRFHLEKPPVSKT